MPSSCSKKEPAAPVWASSTNSSRRVFKAATVSFREEILPVPFRIACRSATKRNTCADGPGRGGREGP
eukprot:4837777-Pyramimonas_sp.AAC.1